MNASRDRGNAVTKSVALGRDAYAVVAPDSTFCAVSPAAAAFWGYTAESLLGQAVTTVLPAAMRATWDAVLPSVFDGRAQTAVVGPATAHTVLGEPVETTLSALTVPSGAIPCVLVTLTPEHRSVDHQLVWSTAQQEQVGSAVHDLNNLLMVIGATAFALHDHDTLSRGEHEELLDGLDSATVRGADIVRGLREATPRAAADPPVVPAGGTHLTTAIRCLTRNLVGVLGAQRPLTCFLDPNVHGVPLAAPDLEQILLDLVTNCRDAMPDGGPVHLATTRRPRADGPGDVVDLVVRDTGCGMSPEVQARIFEPFYSTKAPGVGTGLGLPGVARRVRAAGGEIRVLSQAGQGTTVILTLPHIAVSTVPLARVASAGGAVLLLAVDTAIRRLLQGRLERVGCTVMVAETGWEGVNVARTTPVRLTKVVADLALPDLADGTLLGAIHDYRPSCELFVLATPSSVTSGLVLPAGTTILPPPVDIPALLDRLTTPAAATTAGAPETALA